jgi:hypothetical protein
MQWLDYNKVTKQENISVITNTESVQIWDVNEASPKYSFTREKISEALKVLSSYMFQFSVKMAYIFHFLRGKMQKLASLFGVSDKEKRKILYYWLVQIRPTGT